MTKFSGVYCTKYPSKYTKFIHSNSFYKNPLLAQRNEHISQIILCRNEKTIILAALIKKHCHYGRDKDVALRHTGL